MAEDPQDELRKAWLQAAQKFDYFMAGLSAAVTAYAAKTVTPAPIALSPGTLDLLGFFFFLVASVAAFKRIETFNAGLKVNYGKLDAEDRAASLEGALEQDLEVIVRGEGPRSPEEVAKTAKGWRKAAASLDTTLDKLGRKAVTYYNLRNAALLCGVLALVASRIWASYLGAS